MDSQLPADVVEFGAFRLDRRGSRLFRRGKDGAFEPVRLSARPRALLRMLVDHAGCVVSKQDIVDTVWSCGEPHR